MTSRLEAVVAAAKAALVAATVPGGLLAGYTVQRDWENEPTSYPFLNLRSPTVEVEEDFAGEDTLTFRLPIEIETRAATHEAAQIAVNEAYSAAWRALVSNASFAALLHRQGAPSLDLRVAAGAPDEAAIGAFALMELPVEIQVAEDDPETAA